MKTSTNIPSQNPEAFLQPPERTTSLRGVVERAFRWRGGTRRSARVSVCATERNEGSARGATRSTARLRTLTVLAVILLSLAQTHRAHAALIVTSGTGQIGNGVSLFISQNQVEDGGSGATVGGKVHSPSGAPDLFYRAASTPTFPGALSTYVQWALNGYYYIDFDEWEGQPHEGGQSGTDNWMKVIRDGDGAVTWAQFNFQFGVLPAGTSPTLLGIPKYVWSTDGADFTVAEAAAANVFGGPGPGVGAVPEPTTALIGLACAGIALHRRRRR